MNNKEEASASSPSIFECKNNKKYLLFKILQIILSLLATFLIIVARLDIALSPIHSFHSFYFSYTRTEAMQVIYIVYINRYTPIKNAVV